MSRLHNQTSIVISPHEGLGEINKKAPQQVPNTAIRYGKKDLTD